MHRPTEPARAARAPLHLALIALSLASVAFPAAANHTDDPGPAVTFTAYDVSHLTLYGEGALYRPRHCPHNLTFTNRARLLPELADNVVGIFPSDILADGHACTADALMLQFTPIGRPAHLPPQWVFEDSRLTKLPVNFTCGHHRRGRFSIRYGYLNDVAAPSGFLDPNVVYLDFAVIPNTKPFAFCSYAVRRQDGGRPVNDAPFPTRKTWGTVLERDASRPVPSASPAATPEMTENVDFSLPTSTGRSSLLGRLLIGSFSLW